MYSYLYIGTEQFDEAAVQSVKKTIIIGTGKTEINTRFTVSKHLKRCNMKLSIPG